ncbi:MAG: ABC transporter ATP-binding protein [Siphonobacter sp.]
MDKKSIIQSINLTINPQEIVCLIGPNGAGKTTLIKSLLGVLPHTGETTFDDIDLNGKDRIKALREIGVFIQPNAFYEYLTAYENLNIIQKYYTSTRFGVDQILDIFNLTELKNTKVKDYSLGMKQRLSLAVSFFNKPKFLLLDEPFNAIDRSNIDDIVKFIKLIHAEFKTSFLLSTHSLEEVQKIYTRLLIMNKGSVLLDASKSEIEPLPVQDIYQNTIA